MTEEEQLLKLGALQEVKRLTKKAKLVARTLRKKTRRADKYRAEGRRPRRVKRADLRKNKCAESLAKVQAELLLWTEKAK